MRADEAHLKVFEDLRPQLTGFAYRMTGSLSDADDVVQDAWLRWSRVDAASVDAAKPYLLQIVARLCVDQATSARARREVYVGPWLPEPVADPLAVGAQPSAEQVAELADDLSAFVGDKKPINAGNSVKSAGPTHQTTHLLRPVPLDWAANWAAR
jgi:DNA-directed RNA polymerase specialized sigma24 family protein